MERLQQEDWDLLHSKKQTQRELMEEVSKCNEVQYYTHNNSVSIQYLCGLYCPSVMRCSTTHTIIVSVY